MREAPLPELVGALRCKWEALLEGMVSAGVSYTWLDRLWKSVVEIGGCGERGEGLIQGKKRAPTGKRAPKLSHEGRAHLVDAS